MLSNDAILAHVFRENDFNAVEFEMVKLWPGQNGHLSSLQMFAVGPSGGKRK